LPEVLVLQLKRFDYNALYDKQSKVQKALSIE
jgi:hypothetical protein